MSIPLIIYYHCLTHSGDALLPNALEIIHEQMSAMKLSGLEEAASEIHCGINGGEESRIFVKSLLPAKATVTYHGLQSRSENRTIVLIEEWCKSNADEAHICYFHAKNSTHPNAEGFRVDWANCMRNHVVGGWRKCVSALGEYEVAGCHYMVPPATPVDNYIMAGNFWWARASFLRTLPSIYERQQIKQAGIDDVASRYESEVWIGNGSRPPKVMDYCPNWHPGRPHTA
jgi:hypothetical protein